MIETDKIITTAVDTFDDRHDDMMGDLMTGIAGANQWLTANIGDTLFPMQWLRNNSSDFYCVKSQSPHWRKQGVNLDSIHIHYLLQSAFTAGQTLLFDLYYTWVIPDTVFPSLSGWTFAQNISINLGASKAALYNGIFSIVANVPPPSPEGYGVGLLWRIVRGNGSYNGNLGILWSDAHAVKSKNGSKLEFGDV